MGRKSKNPRVILMLSPAGISTACDVSPEIIHKEILAGRLVVRQLPGTLARRILVKDVERWYRKYWLPAKPVNNKRKSEITNGR